LRAGGKGIGRTREKVPRRTKYEKRGGSQHGGKRGEKIRQNHGELGGRSFSPAKGKTSGLGDVRRAKYEKLLGKGAIKKTHPQKDAEVKTGTIPGTIKTMSRWEKGLKTAQKLKAAQTGEQTETLRNAREKNSSQMGVI